MRAVAMIVKQQGKSVFTREEIRSQADIRREDWDVSYSPIFQGMRKDQPGGAPNVGSKFKNIFRQVRHGEHTLTDYGKELLKEF